jgi:hypothetical protein
VEVVGCTGRCPLLEFLGKADRTSDLVGEKLAEPHVRSVLDRLFAAHSLAPRFALLVPVEGRPARYRLYLQGEGLEACRTRAVVWAADLQRGLEDNPHYRYAVGLGQLAPVEVAVLDALGEPGWHVYERVCLRRGQRGGNIKATALDARTGWPDAFAEQVQDAAATQRR